MSNIFRGNTGHWGKMSCMKSKCIFKVNNKTVDHWAEYAWPLSQHSTSRPQRNMENLRFLMFSWQIEVAHWSEIG